MEHNSAEENLCHSDASEHCGNRSEPSLDLDSVDWLIKLNTYTVSRLPEQAYRHKHYHRQSDGMPSSKRYERVQPILITYKPWVNHLIEQWRRSFSWRYQSIKCACKRATYPQPSPVSHTAVSLTPSHHLKRTSDTRHTSNPGCAPPLHQTLYSSRTQTELP